jgi:hypothetical protein
MSQKKLINTAKTIAVVLDDPNDETVNAVLNLPPGRHGERFVEGDFALNNKAWFQAEPTLQVSGTLFLKAAEVIKACRTHLHTVDRVGISVIGAYPVILRILGTYEDKEYHAKNVTISVVLAQATQEEDVEQVSRRRMRSPTRSRSLDPTYNGGEVATALLEALDAD